MEVYMSVLNNCSCSYCRGARRQQEQQLRLQIDRITHIGNTLRERSMVLNTPGNDDIGLPLPDTMQSVVNARRQERAAARRKHAKRRRRPVETTDADYSGFGGF